VGGRKKKSPSIYRAEKRGKKPSLMYGGERARWHPPQKDHRLGVARAPPRAGEKGGRAGPDLSRREKQLSPSYWRRKKKKASHLLRQKKEASSLAGEEEKQDSILPPL